MIFRVVMLICGTVFLAFGLLGVAAGESGQAAGFALVGAGFLLPDVWPRRFAPAYPVHEWVGIGLWAAGLAALGQVVVGVALFLTTSLVLLAAALFARRAYRRALSLEFEAVGANEVMPGAEAAVAAFEADGFTRAGAYAVYMPSDSERVVGTLLLAPSGDRYAAVTARVIELGSRFGNERWLVTANKATAPLPEDILRQLVARGGRAELTQAHAAAIELLSRRGVRPDRLLPDGELVDLAIATDRRILRFAAEEGWRQSLSMNPRGKKRDPVLGEDRQSRKRVAAWLGT